MMFLAQAAPPELNFWNAPAGSGELFMKIGLGLVLGIGLIFGLLAAPAQLRRPIVATVTFIAGSFFVLYFLWPTPIDRQPEELPVGFVESVGFYIEDSVNVVGNFTNILSAFLLGLGVYSLLRIHTRRFIKQQKDWPFSVVLLVSMLLMVIFGYLDWRTRLGPNAPLMEEASNWTTVNYGRDILFNGILQQMDAAMFSLIAFYILSAAYRAFRVRSVEATILLATALIMILSLMGAATYFWDVRVMGDPSTNSFASNFTLTEVAKWIRDTFQTSSLRGIDFGVGIGALAMGLRLWLSLERQGAS